MYYLFVSYFMKNYYIHYFSTIIFVLLSKNEIICSSQNNANVNKPITRKLYENSAPPPHGETTENARKFSYDYCSLQSLYNSKYMGYYEQKDIVLQQ